MTKYCLLAVFETKVIGQKRNLNKVNYLLCDERVTVNYVLCSYVEINK